MSTLVFVSHLGCFDEILRHLQITIPLTLLMNLTLHLGTFDLIIYHIIFTDQHNIQFTSKRLHNTYILPLSIYYTKINNQCRPNFHWHS